MDMNPFRSVRIKLPPLPAIAVIMNGAGCVNTPRPESVPARLSAGSIGTPEQAIAVVQRRVRASGGDPEQLEITARRQRSQWLVTAWRVVYPNNTGASRFTPGGYTTYVVGADGRVIDTLPGR